ncbi:phosphatase PAP2 family protein [Isoptericola sp. NPDC057191]|uniref:phosphatase PAP2 family protein n=1 Tax=Isoptericola sp. NPDC057191 TaxID=3346041 RepID=UPI0036381CA2
MTVDRWWSAVRRYDAGTLAVTSVLLVVALLADYGFAVRTAAGQRLDVAAFGDVSLLHDLFGTPAGWLRDAAPVLLAAAALVLGVLALAHGRWRSATAGALATGAALAAATVLRDVVLDRPMLGGHGYAQNTLPSGHVAAVTALALAVLLLWPGVRPAPPRWAVVGGAGVVAAAAGASVVTYAHRPSDVVAGVLVGVLATTLSCWLVRPPLAVAEPRVVAPRRA